MTCYQTAARSFSFASSTFIRERMKVMMASRANGYIRRSLAVYCPYVLPAARREVSRTVSRLAGHWLFCFLIFLKFQFFLFNLGFYFFLC